MPALAPDPRSPPRLRKRHPTTGGERPFGEMMSKFRLKVLRAVWQHEYTGPIEVLIQLGLWEPGIEEFNVRRAITAMEDGGFIEPKDFCLTPKGKAFLAMHESNDKYKAELLASA